MKKKFRFRLLLPVVLLWWLNTGVSFGQTGFRIHPYLQVYDNGRFQITWFSNNPLPSTITIKDGQQTLFSNNKVVAIEAPEIYYTNGELGQTIPGLPNGSWLEGAKAYKYRVNANSLPAGKTLTYTVTLGSESFESAFRTPPAKDSWQSIRFVALSDSETEPRGRVTYRTWYPGTPTVRPFTIPQLWRDKFGTTVEQGNEIPNYMLTEKDGYAANLKIINSRNPDFMLMPGDLVQGGGYQPGWDEFFRHNAGEFDKGLTRYPIVPAIGNWESFGGSSGAYRFNERGEFAPVVGRKRFHAYFETPISDPLQKHRQSYYRMDYGPVTVLTLDSGNGLPEQSRSDFADSEKLTGKQYSVPGTDPQENFTKQEYDANGGDDLSGFAPGTEQYTWLEHHLKTASEAGQLIFIQFHHSPYSSGEHGLPINHVLSSGQGGTPLRILHPLFERYGVIAVLAGHDEIFERSFVDEDGDGKGVHYYDVGVAGDGMRGEKRLSHALSELLDYNPYKKWTADQSSAEVWNTSGPRPVLEDGGKHYGHLEVNVENIRENGQEYARIRFSPVYAFPVINADYNLIRIERRIYNDEVEVKIPLGTSSPSPKLKESVTLVLDEKGLAPVNPADLFISPGAFQPNEFTMSKTQFSCQDTGENILGVSIQKDGETWSGEIKVSVTDQTPPTLTVKPFHIEIAPDDLPFTLNAADFVSEVGDNCEVVEVLLDRTTVSFADIGKSIPIEVTAVDKSGNRTSQSTQVTVGELVLSLPLKLTLKIYPNPSTGHAELELPSDDPDVDHSFKIFDVQGRDVTASTEIQPSPPTGYAMDISRLPSATYIIVLEIKGQRNLLGRVVKN